MENGDLPSRRGHDGVDADRVRTVIACEVRQGSRPWAAVRLEDISATGFRIAAFPECRPELELRVRIPGLQLLNAKVCWKEGASVGCEFAQPLHIAVFDHIVRQAGG